MSEDEAIDILQNCIADYVIGEYCDKCDDRPVCADKNEDCYFQQAIETILELYKQEKEKNKNLIKQLQEQNTEIQDISKQLREKEQEDIKMRAKFVLSLDDYILKDKIKAKIEKLKKLYDESKGLQGDVNILYHIGYLKELLEEN